MSHTPGPWQVWTSNSWRRIFSRDHGSVCEPITQNDGHPDLFFKNGGPEGPDAKLIEAAPDLLSALKIVRDTPMIYTGAICETLADSGQWPDLLDTINAAIAKAEPKPEYPQHCTTPEPCIAAGRCTRDPNCID